MVVEIAILVHLSWLESSKFQIYKFFELFLKVFLYTLQKNEKVELEKYGKYRTTWRPL